MGKGYEVTTESNAKYIINTDLKVMRRERSDETPADPVVLNNHLDYDGTDHPYLEILTPIEVGGFLAIAWIDNGRYRVRTSTYITDVKEWDVPAPPDQPAGSSEGTAP